MHETDSDILVWWATRVECRSTVMRLVREAHLDQVGEAQFRARLDALFVSAGEVEPTNEVRDRAERILAVHPLRATDAFQLAAALVWARERTTGLGFVCLDNRLRRAASLEGFSVLPAEQSLRCQSDSLDRMSDSRGG